MTKEEVMKYLRENLQESETKTKALKNLGEWLKINVSRDFDTLAGKLIDTYEKRGLTGKRQGTNVYWTGSRLNIKNRLASSNIDLSKYSDEEIVSATEKYLDNSSDKKYARSLAYFIWKCKDGNIVESDLLSSLEKGSEENFDDGTNTDWIYSK